MTKQDTSQIGICKNSSHKLQDITQLVNKSTSKIRLQAVKFYSSDDSKEVLVLGFYPNFKDLAFLWDSSEVVGVEMQKLDRNLLKAAKHPFILYLKAHFVGHELLGMDFEGEKITFRFQAERSFTWDFSNKEWLFKVEGRKDYSQRLPLWASLHALLPGEENSISKKVVEVKAKAESKFEKLKSNVERDIADAKDWLERNNSAIEYFFQSPQMWGEDLKKIPREFHSWIEEISKTISFKGSRKAALENLKKLQNRFQRKVEKAQQRLEQLSRSAPKIIEEKKQKVAEAQQEKSAGPKKVLLSEDVEAIVGRKATENDELFRKAQSRDLWFHVRGQRGAHVWVRRGQKGFGAKGELNETMLRKAATLAAKYSKAAGTWISVDYTERRFLKKLKGSDAGALQVLQSKSIFVSIDED